MQIEPIQKLSPISCPHCQGTTGHRADDADTIDVEAEGIDPSRYIASLLQVDCGECARRFYGITLYVVSQPMKGSVLAIDNCQKPDATRFYRITEGPGKAWELEHQTCVSEVGYSRISDGENFAAPQALDWLNIHFLHHFAGEGVEPFSFASFQCRFYLPRVLQLWSGNGEEHERF